MRVQDPDPPIKVEPRDLDDSAKVAVVAHHECCLERTAVRKIDKIDRKADIRALLARQLDLDRPASDLLWPHGRRAAP